MENELTHPKYIYADILIALADADGVVDPRERELLDSFFDQMELDKETIQEMWLTPRTLDVIESLLSDIPDRTFKHCILKDCYLLAYADQKIDPEENHFIKRISGIMDVDAETKQRIHAWVKLSLAQKDEADELFGPGAATRIGGY